MEELKMIRGVMVAKAVTECLNDIVDSRELFTAVISTVIDKWCEKHGEDAVLSSIVVSLNIMHKFGHDLSDVDGGINEVLAKASDVKEFGVDWLGSGESGV